MRFIGHNLVVASVLDYDKDHEFLFTDKWQARVFYDEMVAYGNDHLSYREHN